MFAGFFFLFLQLLCVVFPRRIPNISCYYRYSPRESCSCSSGTGGADSKLPPAARQCQRKPEHEVPLSVYADTSLQSCCKGLSCSSLSPPPLSSPTETDFGLVCLNGLPIKSLCFHSFSEDTLFFFLEAQRSSLTSAFKLAFLCKTDELKDQVPPNQDLCTLFIPIFPVSLSRTCI